MKDSVVEKTLCTTGYLPPRNEEEMIAFEKVFSKEVVDANFHVNIDSIVNGRCRIAQINSPVFEEAVAENDLRMAARNFEQMPATLIEKLKRQHHGNADEDW